MYGKAKTEQPFGRPARVLKELDDAGGGGDRERRFSLGHLFSRIQLRRKSAPAAVASQEPRTRLFSLGRRIGTRPPEAAGVRPRLWTTSAATSVVDVDLNEQFVDFDQQICDLRNDIGKCEAAAVAAAADAGGASKPGFRKRSRTEIMVRNAFSRLKNRSSGLPAASAASAVETNRKLSLQLLPEGVQVDHTSPERHPSPVATDDDNDVDDVTTPIADGQSARRQRTVTFSAFQTAGPQRATNNKRHVFADAQASPYYPGADTARLSPSSSSSSSSTTLSRQQSNSQENMMQRHEDVVMPDAPRKRLKTFGNLLSFSHNR